MTESQYKDLNEVALTPVMECLMEACYNYLDEVYSGEQHIEKADEALRLAIAICRDYLDLRIKLRGGS